MDQYRVTQIIQELINDKNNELSQLNNYLSEAQTSSWNYVNPQDYQNMVNEKDMAWGRVSDLQNQLTSVQQNYDMFVSNSSNSLGLSERPNSIAFAVTRYLKYASRISLRVPFVIRLDANPAFLRALTASGY